MPYPEIDAFLCKYCGCPIPISLSTIEETYHCPDCDRHYIIHIVAESVDPQPIDPRHVC